MVTIQVKLMGMLKPRQPADGLSIPPPATIADALRAMAIPLDSVKVFSVNGSLVQDQQHGLRNGDELTVLPPVGGG